MAFHNLQRPPHRHIICEANEYLLKLAAQNFPLAIIIEGVQNINDDTIGALLDGFGNPGDLCIITAGWPCKGHSFLRVERPNLADPASGLFWEFVRIRKLVKSIFKGIVKVIAENVVMDGATRKIISVALGCEAILIDATPVSIASRPRLWWTDFEWIKSQVKRSPS